MSESIPPDLVDRMMVKCARRCCICRRYRPTKLQVHHIVERGQGGGNEEDNLLVTCLSCHTDVHTKVPFARRFSVNELKGHRDALVKMVEEGKLPQVDTDDADEVIRSIVQAMESRPRKEMVLSPEAAEVLLRAINAVGARQGSIALEEWLDGLTIRVGGGPLVIGQDKRLQAKYKHAIRQLVTCALLEQVSADGATTIFEVTDEGYLAADELTVGQGRASGDSTPGSPT
jgi:hypothetical protein